AESQTRLAHAHSAGGPRACSCADASLPHHAFQSADVAHDGDLVSHAALVSMAHHISLAAYSHDVATLVDRRPLVRTNRTRDFPATDTRRHLARATAPPPVDVQ